MTLKHNLSNCPKLEHGTYYVNYAIAIEKHLKAMEEELQQLKEEPFQLHKGYIKIDEILGASKQ